MAEQIDQMQKRTGTASTQVMSTSSELARNAEELRATVTNFLSNVKAA